MKNKTLKIIYKMRRNKIKERDIKKQLKEKYNINCTMPELKKILNKIPIRYDKYTEIEKIKYTTNLLVWRENINYYNERRSETIIGDTNLFSIWYSPDYNFIYYKGL